MEFLTRAWRRVFPDDSSRIEAVYKGELLPFAEFAASRLLRVSPGQDNKGPIHGALLKIAKSYLKADVSDISNCITRYRMSTLMSDIAASRSEGPHDLELLKGLMFLLEKLLLEYLSQNWDIVEDVLRVNREADLSKSESVASLSRVRTGSSQSLAARDRVRRNWQRAYRVAVKQIVLNTFAVKRTAVTMTQVFTELNRAASMPSTLTEAPRPDRTPILLLLGGGMAAGKSTAREIIGSDAFWSKMGKDAVVVEADAIKNQDVVYQALQERLSDDPGVSQLVHEYSTNAAEAMLVQALNEQRDVIFDGTMTWLPFVEQTIAMARDHTHNYRRGPGYYQDAQGQVHEKYWEIDPDSPVVPGMKVPYRIELVGVTCDPGLAVARGIWRKIRTGRGVPVSAQLRIALGRLFSNNFEEMAKLVDSATLYHTGSDLTRFSHCDEEAASPKVICHRSSVTRGDLLVNPSAMAEFVKIRGLNDSATDVSALYSNKYSLSAKAPSLERTLTQTIGSSPVSSIRNKLVKANKNAIEETLSDVGDDDDWSL